MMRGNERGAVLLLVLLVVALLSAILTDWAFTTLVDLRLTETFRDGNRAYYLARGGVEAGRQILRVDTNGYDAPGEMWETGVPAYPLGEDATVAITLQDEDGRLNLNRIVDPIGENPDPVRRDRFRRLLEQLAAPDPEALADALIDWIDRNDTLAPRGAESAWYRTQLPPGTVKNGPLDTVDELLLVRGFTPDLVRRLSPFVTIANTERLNLNTVTEELLACWDADFGAAEIAQLVARRAEKPFKSLVEVQEALGLAAFSALNRNLDVGVASNYYRIVAEARVGDGVRTVEALVRKSDNRLLVRRVY